MTGSRGAVAHITRHGYGKKVKKTEFAQRCEVAIGTDKSEAYNGCQRELVIESDYKMDNFDITVINHGLAITMSMSFQQLQMLVFAGEYIHDHRNSPTLKRKDVSED